MEEIMQAAGVAPAQSVVNTAPTESLKAGKRKNFLHFRATPGLEERLRLLAEAHGWPLSTAIREALREGLDRLEYIARRDSLKQA